MERIYITNKHWVNITKHENGFYVQEVLNDGHTVGEFWICKSEELAKKRANTIKIDYFKTLEPEDMPTISEDELFRRISKRAKELLSIPEVMAIYQSKESEAAAQDWIFLEAVFTLCYSHDERVALSNNNNN